MNEFLEVTVVGNDILEDVEDAFRINGFKSVKLTRLSKLGNLKTFTYFFDFPTAEIIRKRKELSETLFARRIDTLYVYGNWMKIFVTKRRDL